MAAIICTATPPSFSMASQYPKPQSQPMPCMYRITEAAGRIHIALIGGDEPEGFVADHPTVEDAKNHLRGRHPDSKGWQLTFRQE
jgi:hypothetical protein